MSHTPDCIVVGGGIIGLATALEFWRNGATVSVIDAGYTPASAAGAGILSALPPWEYSKEVVSLIEESSRRIGSVIHEIESNSDVKCEWQRPGMLVLDEQLSSAGIGTMTPARWLAPLIANSDKRHGIWLPDVSKVRAGRLCAGMSAWLKKMGVQFVHAQAQLEYEGGKVKNIRLADGSELSAGSYVICTGAYGGVLCPSPCPPIMPMRGQLLLYHSPKPLLSVVFSPTEGIYMAPCANGNILAGASYEDAGFDNRPSAEVLAELHRKAVALFPPLAMANVLDSWSGLRPCLPDDLPVISPHPACENLYVNGGHGRYGMSMALAAARRLFNIVNTPKMKNPFAFRDEWLAA